MNHQILLTTTDLRLFIMLLVGSVFFFMLNMWLYISSCFGCFSPGLSASYQKWRGTKKAQQTHQHYLTDQTIHNCPQHNCSVLDLRNWTGRLIIPLPPKLIVFVCLYPPQQLFWLEVGSTYVIIRQIKQKLQEHRLCIHLRSHDG